MTTNRNTHHLTVGDRAHRIAAAMARETTASDRASTALALTRCARSVFTAFPVEYRPREAFLDAVTAAGVYLRRFQPMGSWQLLDRELVDGRNRFDLVHQNTETSVLIDEIKLGVGRSGEAAVQQQLDRYTEAGTRLWGSRFLGVRLCAVHEPLQSQLYLPDGRTVLLLTESGLPDGVAVR